jgi:class 3 adenylate cyclase
MNISEKFSGFKSAERPSTGLALVFDISGFTNFFNKPDIQDYITDYINNIIDCVETCIWGGEVFWIEVGSVDRELPPMSVRPSLRKFLGDGMLYVWENTEEEKLDRIEFNVILLNRLWNIHNNFSKINKLLRDQMPIAELPKQLKFGLAQGTVYKLTENDGSIDYIGPCINLASRLVKYCPNLNIVASSRLNIDKETLLDNNYIKTIAKELRSFESEIVIVDKGDYDKLSDDEKEKLFEDL